MSGRSAVASSRLSKNGSLLKCWGTGLPESTLCSLCSRATRGRRRGCQRRHPAFGAAPQGNCSAGTATAVLALNPLLRKRFPAGDPIQLDGATTTRPAACGDRHHVTKIRRCDPLDDVGGPGSPLGSRPARWDHTPPYRPAVTHSSACQTKIRSTVSRTVPGVPLLRQAVA